MAESRQSSAALSIDALIVSIRDRNWPEFERIERLTAGRASVKTAGFEIGLEEIYATQGMAVKKARRDRINMGSVGK